MFLLVVTAIFVGTLEIPGPAMAGDFDTNDTGAAALLSSVAGTGTYTTGSNTVTRTGSIDNYVSRIDNLATEASTGGGGDAIEEGLWTGGEDMGFLPGALPTLGTILLGVGAFYLGWKIGRGIDDMYAKLSGEMGQVVVADRGIAAKWVDGSWTRCMATVGVSTCYEAQVETTDGVWEDRYVGEASGAPCPAVPYDGAAYCGLTKSFEALLAAPGATKYTWPTGVASCSDQPYSGGCYSIFMAQMPPLHVQAFESVPAGTSPPAWYSSSAKPIVQSLTGSYTIPAGSASPTQLAQARTDVDASGASAWANVTTSGAPDPYAGSGGAGTPSQVTMPDCTGLTQDQCTALLESAGEIGTITIETLSPGGANVDLPAGSIVSTDPAGGAQVDSNTAITISVNPDAADMPFALPQPLSNETYDQYIARLQALGWVGTATQIVLDSSNADSATGPNGVVQINLVTANGTTTLVKRAYWPATSIAVLKSAPITFSVNPPTEPPAPDPGPGPGETPGGTPSGAIDFTPITSIDPGCRFPYGFICYAKEVSDWFNVAPQAPSFDFTIGSTTGLEGEIGQHDFHVDLGDSRVGLDGYMSLIRDLESIVLWIGGVYFLATRLLGFNAGGDPGEVIDEAQPW